MAPVGGAAIPECGILGPQGNAGCWAEVGDRLRSVCRGPRMIVVMAVETRLDAWLSVLDERDGTDILLTDGSKPLIRVGGQLAPLEDAEPLTGEEIEVIAEDPDPRPVRRPAAPRPRGRLLLLLARPGPDQGQRVLPTQPVLAVAAPHPDADPDAERAWAPRRAGRRSCAARAGCILVTGPTGSGKSTSMASMIDVINRNRRVSHRHHRGPDRVPAHQPDGGGEPARGRDRHRVVRARPCAPSFARTPTWCWSARCATSRASRLP